MLALPANARIFLCKESTNMGKSFEGLCTLVEMYFPEPPTSGAYFSFINRRRDSMKVLYWDSDGFSIWYKRLEKGTFLVKNSKATLSRRDFLMLLEGVEPKHLQRRYKR
jgi:transposase